jgi:hypothetical protein
MVPETTWGRLAWAIVLVAGAWLLGTVLLGSGTFVALFALVVVVGVAFGVLP